SQELDRETNFYFYNARYYDPQIGRFTSADTMIDGARSTQGWNRFSYVAGNPIRYKDPTGHEAEIKNAFSHVVSSGDQLRNITNKLNTSLKTNFNVYQVARANGIKNPNLIKVGQKINIPILNKGVDRRSSILNDSASIFNIAGNNRVSGKSPAYELRFFSEVKGNANTIASIASKKGIDKDLINAIMYMETTHGYYDRLDPTNKSIRPMNIHYKYWGKNRSDMEIAEKNIEFGAGLLKSIQQRLQKPTVEKAATLYNNMSADEVSEYGAQVGRIYKEKTWTSE
ncbi:RHS repeat-associated core domain-containing protein, partial [Leptospira wolffii]